MLTCCCAILLLASAQDSMLQRKPGFRKVQEWKSEYATQAAAADEEHIYAVSSTHVVVYERRSGKLLAKSEGPAEHLNSAFLWQGKLYCAHSNYPKKPDESEIKVFDLKSRKLTTFHRFEKPPGSLVWNIHDGKHWWCCFAFYQEENARTVLIEMTEEFKELRRWTFPKNVIDDWDKMSASGGLFDGNDLLVTHHHFKVLYRLRVPKQGDVLEFVEALDAPFPGQGIARDPKTNGLIGIDRPRRIVVLAEAVKR